MTKYFLLSIFMLTLVGCNESKNTNKKNSFIEDLEKNGEVLKYEEDILPKTWYKLTEINNNEYIHYPISAKNTTLSISRDKVIIQYGIEESIYIIDSMIKKGNTYLFYSADINNPIECKQISGTKSKWTIPNNITISMTSDTLSYETLYEFSLRKNNIEDHFYKLFLDLENNGLTANDSLSFYEIKANLDCEYMVDFGEYFVFLSEPDTNYYTLQQLAFIYDYSFFFHNKYRFMVNLPDMLDYLDGNDLILNSIIQQNNYLFHNNANSEEWLKNNNEGIFNVIRYFKREKY